MSETSSTEASSQKVNVRCSNAQKLTVPLDTSCTVVAFKAQIATEADIPVGSQRLIYKGKVLKDEETLASYGVEADSTIHLVRAPAPSTAPAPAPVPNTMAMSGAPLGFPFGGLPAAGGNMPDVSRMQEQLLSNPDLMANVMNSPMIQNMLSDPETLRNMFMANPQMRQVMESNPQLAHVLNDPTVMRQTLEMMRNPNAMREAMRSQDLAMSNIESHPEGFNALRRMYTEVQEPMMQATADMAASGGTANRPPATATAPGSAAPAMPNPWAQAGAGSTGAAGTGAGANPWAAAMGGMGGMGMGGMGGMGMPPGMGDPAQMAQMMQNPMMQQMMQQMANDPNAIEQMIQTVPHLREMAAADPSLRAQLPHIMQSMSDPNTVQAMMQMQQSMAQLQRAGIIPPGAMGMPPMGNNMFNPPQQAAGGLDFSSLLGVAPAPVGGGYGLPAALPPVPQANPEETYASQLSQLQAMGFPDAAANLRALVAARGNVNLAVERLLGGGL